MAATETVAPASFFATTPVAAVSLTPKLECRRAARLCEVGPVPEDDVTVFDLDLIGAHLRRCTVHLERPAAEAGRRIAADVVDVRAETGHLHVVVELTADAGRLEGLERRRRRRARLRRAEDRLALSFHTYANDCGRGGAHDCEHERNDHREHESASKHESSFHEGFGSTGGRSSDSGLPTPPPSQRQPVAWWQSSVSPHSGGTVPDLHRVP